jgi:hypothetical protein
MLQRVKLAVDNVGGKTLGVVLNNVDIRHDQSYEYYTSYYNYYHKAVASPQKKRTESNLESVQVVEHVKSKDKNSEY